MIECYFSEVQFYVKKLKAQRDFFESLKYDCTAIIKGQFEVMIGRTKLIYHSSEMNNVYHYCILIDASQIEEKYQLLQSLNLDIVTFEEKELVHNSSWNSDSLYFNDPNGGMPELIAHHSINKRLEKEQLAEVGMAIHNTDDAGDKLFSKCGLSPFKGTTNRFYDIGIPGTMFIIIDPVQKPFWFPYNYVTNPAPAKGRINIDGQENSFEFRDGILYLE